LRLGAFDQSAVLEACARAHEWHDLGAGDRAPAVLGRLDQLEHHRQGRGRAPAYEAAPERIQVAALPVEDSREEIKKIMEDSTA
jgi:hypothetical protein